MAKESAKEMERRIFFCKFCWKKGYVNFKLANEFYKGIGKKERAKSIEEIYNDFINWLPKD